MHLLSLFSLNQLLYEHKNVPRISTACTISRCYTLDSFDQQLCVQQKVPSGCQQQRAEYAVGGGGGGICPVLTVLHSFTSCDTTSVCVCACVIILKLSKYFLSNQASRLQYFSHAQLN